MTRAAVMRPCDVAERWQCSERHIIDMIELKLIQAFRIGRGMYRIHEHELCDPIPEPYQKPDPIVTVYIIKSGPFVKIGFSAKFETRLKTLSNANPESLEVVRLFEKPMSFEEVLHDRFSAHHHKLEWFRLEGELADWIERGCPDVGNALPD